MLTHARNVLGDCHLALELLEEETDSQRWRTRWVGAVALVRAVGHVLDKGDGVDPAARVAVNAAYRKWKDCPHRYRIFHGSIEKERNLILKQYEFNTFPNEAVPLVVVARSMSPGGDGVAEYAEVFDIKENLYRPLVSGFWEGEDARDVYVEALEWWEAQLAEIESAIMERRA